MSFQGHLLREVRPAVLTLERSRLAVSPRMSFETILPIEGLAAFETLVGGHGKVRNGEEKEEFAWGAGNANRIR